MALGAGSSSDFFMKGRCLNQRANISAFSTEGVLFAHVGFIGIPGAVESATG